MIAQGPQVRYRGNKYLDLMNESLFKPRRPFAMVMAYKPKLSDDLFLRADISDPASLDLSKAFDGSTSKAKEFIRRMRYSSGTANGDVQIPECAQLIYPSLDAAVARIRASRATPQSHAVDRPSESSMLASSRNAIQGNSAVLNDCFDRRAQAESIASSPNSKMETIPGSGKWAKREVLYLMNINLPTEAEPAEVSLNWGRSKEETM